MALVPPTSVGGGAGGGAGAAPGLAAPVHGIVGNGQANIGANALIATRVVIPTTGTLHDLSVFITVTGGNVSGAVYNTAAPRARLYTTGAIATGGAGAWQVLGDPNLAVTAGDMYDFAVTTDSGVAAFAYYNENQFSAALWKLPANFLPGAGGAPWLLYTVPASHPAPATIAEASFAQTALAVLIFARIA